MPFLERFAKATGQATLVLNFDESPQSGALDRRMRVRRVLGDYVFNPWDRNPTPAEARSLEADGLTRERFGLDDLYLDRLRQATVDDGREGVEFKSALAVVAARYEEIDWSYVRRRFDEIRRREGGLADSMKRVDSKIRRRVRRALGEPPEQ